MITTFQQIYEEVQSGTQSTGATELIIIDPSNKIQYGI